MCSEPEGDSRHLQDPLIQMANTGEVVVQDFPIDIGRISEQLNCVWPVRVLKSEIPEKKMAELSKISVDLDPVDNLIGDS